MATAQNQNSCRICLGDGLEEDLENPLITPCSCSGTMRFIHVDCLKAWLASKREMREQLHAVSYLWRELQCELCKQFFPDTYAHKGKHMQFIEYSIPEDGPYIVLESAFKSSKNSKIIHVLHLAFKNQVIL